MSSSSTTAVAGDSPAAPPSESSIVAEAVSGSHVVTIQGYSKTKGLGNGNCVTSGAFAVGGHSWCVCYFPDGSDKDSADCVSLFLRRVDHAGGGRGVRAWFKISLLDDAGEPAPAFSRDSTLIFTFTDAHTQWGYNKFITRAALEQTATSFSFLFSWTQRQKRCYLKDDCLRIRCDIAVCKEICTADGPARPPVVVPPPNIGPHLGRLLSSGDGADVVFEVDDETFAAHRCILAARSPVFMAELFGGMKEKTAACVRIDDMEARVFKAMLHFVYTDSLPEIGHGERMVMAQHLLVAADRYGLDRMKLVCEAKLCSYVGTSNVSTMLALAYQHNCPGLKKSCFAFLRCYSNLTAAMETDEFENLKGSCPSVLAELLANVAL
ncbi:hypothetical protein ACP4OV_001907 [Aristida adscensionis]